MFIHIHSSSCFPPIYIDIYLSTSSSTWDFPTEVPSRPSKWHLQVGVCIQLTAGPPNRLPVFLRSCDLQGRNSFMWGMNRQKHEFGCSHPHSLQVAVAVTSNCLCSTDPAQRTIDIVTSSSSWSSSSSSSSTSFRTRERRRVVWVIERFPFLY